MFRNRFKTSVIGLAISSVLVLMLSLATAAPAFADGGGNLVPTITGATGPTVVNYADTSITSPATLNGTNTSMSIKMPLTVTDATGTGNGWTVYTAAQQFSTGTDLTTFHTIPNTAITFASTVADTGTGAGSAPLGCVSESACSLPTTLTANATQLNVETASLTDGTGPSITYVNTGYTSNVIASASKDHGMGAMNIEADFTVSLPANTTYAGTYSSTFAVTFTSGPVA